MIITPAQTQKILTGNHMFSQLGFSMLVTRLKGVYAKDASQDVLQNCMNEMNAFLKKYDAIMLADYSVIANL